MPVKLDYHHVLAHLLYTWIVCFGSLTALILGGMVLPHVWRPLLAIGLMACVSLYALHRQNVANSNCAMLSHYTNFTLFLSAMTMLFINLCNTRWLNLNYINIDNPEIPFISSLIVYPWAALMFGIAVLRRGKNKHCDACRRRAGYTMHDTLECNVFHNEAKSLLYLAFLLSLLLSVVSWLYYFFYYININISTSDNFVFLVVPATVFLLSVFFLGQKYSSMKFEITMASGSRSKEINTMLRFIVIHEDRVLLHSLMADQQALGLWDTPAVIEMPYSEDVDDATARRRFEERAGKTDMQLRRLFTTNTSSHNTFHYAVVLDKQDEEGNNSKSFLRGEWFNIYEIDSMLKSGIVTRPFAYEIHRIFTITMAWKTYDLNGKRLYPIKNYRPTFRLSDFKDWTVDYSDKRWLAIAENNEDRPFFKLRKFWRRHISGIEK